MKVLFLLIIFGSYMKANCLESERLIVNDFRLKKAIINKLVNYAKKRVIQQSNLERVSCRAKGHLYEYFFRYQKTKLIKSIIYEFESEKKVKSIYAVACYFSSCNRLPW